MKPRIPETDPLKLVRQLDAEVIRLRIADLDRERDALLVLLRAAQRATRDKTAKEVRDGE